MRWLRTAWRETPGGLRALSLALWLVGAALVGFGWWGDQVGFWADKPFITNVFSSVTAVSFGVPLALIVVERMGVAQAEAVEARAARRLAAKVVGDLVLAVPRLRPGAASKLRDAEAGLRVVERAAQEAIRQWESSRDQESVRALRQFVEDGSLLRTLEDFRVAVRPGRQAVPVVAEVAAHWSFLNTTVRSRLLETGETWLEAPLAAQIDGMVGRLTADPYMDGWLRDVDMALRRFSTSPDLSFSLRDLWVQLELGAELAEAIAQLGRLTAEASLVLASGR